jgi:hypothetical protein
MLKIKFLQKTLNYIKKHKIYKIIKIENLIFVCLNGLLFNIILLILKKNSLT